MNTIILPPIGGFVTINLWRKCALYRVAALVIPVLNKAMPRMCRHFKSWKMGLKQTKLTCFNNFQSLPVSDQNKTFFSQYDRSVSVSVSVSKLECNW